MGIEAPKLDKGTLLRFYKQRGVQQEILKSAEGREVGVRFREGGFGKRPDTLQYPNDIIELVKAGASSFHTKGHFNRAVMEGVAYSLHDSMDALKSLGIEITDTVRIIGGGAKSALWRQIVADTLDIPMISVLTDDSSIGSAMLAGVSSGVFKSFEHSVEVCTKMGAMVYPNRENRAVYDRGFEFYKRIHDALAPIYKDMAK